MTKPKDPLKSFSNVELVQKLIHRLEGKKDELEDELQCVQGDIEELCEQLNQLREIEGSVM